MLDPTLSTAATATLEAAVNKALQYDPASRLRLQALAGKSLAIELTDLNLQLSCHFDAEGLRFSAFGRTIDGISHTDQPDTRLRGSLAGLLSLAGSDNINLLQANVEAWGNTALLAEIKAVGKDLEIDWEEAINDWLGDIAGHQLAETLRFRFNWLKQRARSGKRLLSEFLTEELRALPSQPELQRFSDEVDELRLASDRLEARLQHYVQQKSRAQQQQGSRQAAQQPPTQPSHNKD